MPEAGLQRPPAEQKNVLTRRGSKGDAPTASHDPVPPGRGRALGTGEPLPAGPAVRAIGRALVTAGGLLLVAGAFLPWAYVPIGRMSLPLPGILGLGGLSLLVGLLFALRPRLHPLVALAVSLAVAVLVPMAGDALARQVRGGLIAFQVWLGPLNRLLDQFHIAGIDVVDLARPRASYLGPGLAVTAWGAGAAALGSLVRLFTAGEGPAALQDRVAPRRCPACAIPVPRARPAHFCPRCGASLGGPPLCPACRTPAEPADHFCTACGVPIPRSEGQ
jgi:Double zinc ribbon